MVKDEILKEKAKRIIESGDKAKMDFLTIVASHKGSIMADSIYTSFRRFKEEHGEKKFEEIREGSIEEGIISISSSGGIQLGIKNEKGDYDYQKGEELSIFLGKLIFDHRPQMMETIEKHLEEPEGKEFFRYISEKDGILTSDGARPEIEEAIGKKSYNRIIKDLVELGILIEYSWSSRKHGYQGYEVLPSVDLFIKEKLSPFELSSLKRELEDNGLSGSEIYRCFDVLRKIYLGQNIHSEGILQSSFSEYRKEIETLLKYGFIREDRWYSHNLYLTTEKGSKAGKLLLEELIKKRKSKAVDAILNLPHNLIGFLLFDYMAPSLIYPVDKEYPFDWREPLAADSRIWICRNKLLSKLEELGLSIKTYLFVSTRGGELRGEHYVISEEIRNFLKNCTAYKEGLYGKEKKMSLLYDFFSKARHILLIDDINEVRERYYNEMERLGLTEEEIEEFVNQMAKKGISSKYEGLLSDRVPFSIKDDSRYNIYIKESSIKPVIHYLLGRSEKRIDIEDEEVEKERTETVHRIEREKIKYLKYDVFICHASEDKDPFVRPLAVRLRLEGLKVWYDDFTLKLGDNVRRKIDEGLRGSRYGVVVLSKSFFQKEWPQNELEGLFAREVNGEKVILPIWHQVTKEDVTKYSPMLAGKLAASTDEDLEKIVQKILEVVGKERNGGE